MVLDHLGKRIGTLTLHAQDVYRFTSVSRDLNPINAMVHCLN